MPRSTAETLKQIQKQGLSISIISADSPKPVTVETGSKEMRPKQIAVVSETLPINSRSASSTENKPTVSQVRQISNATVETRSTTQSASLANQTAQTGANNKLSPVSSTSEMKLQSSQKLNNPNSVENKCQFSASNRNAQTEKNQSNVRHPQNASVPENKAQSNRNMLTFSGALDVKPNRNIPVESKTSIIHSRTQNQNVTTDSKTNSNQSRLAVASPPLEGKTNSNPGRLLSQSNSTPVLDKSIGQRNQLLVTEIKTPNQCKIIPVKQSDIKTASASKGHQNVKVISQPRAISQFQPSAVRVSGNSNNGKPIVNKSSVNAISEHSLYNPFRVASALVKNEEKSVYKVTKVTPNATTSESQSFQPKKIIIPLKSENKPVNQSVKISELPPELLQKPIQIENSSEAQSTGVNIMPKTSVKRVAAATSTPVSANTRKYIKIASSSVSDQSGSQSDLNTLSSDESPVKEKKVFNLRSITPGLTITPVQTSTPSASTSTKKPVESNQNIIVICPSCSQCSYNMTSCDSCHEVFTSTPVRYHLKNAQTDSASIVVTQNVTTNIQKTMNVVYHISPNQNFKFQQTQQLVKVSPRRGRPKRRYVEPVCYTLSSDEEEALPFESIPDDINRQILYSHDLEENPESEHSSNSDMMQEENPEFDDPQYPGVTRIGTRFVSKHGLNHDMEEGEEDEEQEDEEMEHDMESEEELMDEVGIEQPEFDEEDEELEEEEEEEIPPDEEERFMNQFNKIQSLLPKKIVLKCRSIRIGSYKIHPEEHTNSLHVTITDRTLHFLAPLITDSKTFVEIMLMATDVGNMMIHFGKCLPIIFVLTTESFGEYVRRTLHMNKSHSELFLPKSNDFKKNKLTFLIDSLTDDQRTFMRQIFPGQDKLQEIDQKEANEILVKSTPNVTNVVKITQDSHVSSSPSSQAGITVAGLPPGLSSQALSITKVTVKPGPPAPVVKILTYPPPPQTGGIAINTADLATLEEGEFLNDAILDFYLKYVFYEKLSPRDREKTHIFSSFFYPRLTQKPDRIRPGDDGPKSMQVRRHNQVKTWTKHVDIFSKDYIVIPVNQHNHWFLAFICYPGHIPDPPVEKTEPKTAKATDIVTSSNDHVMNKVIIKEETSITEDSQTQADIVNNDSSYEVEEPPDSDEDDSSELPERNPNSNVTYYEGGRRKETPCILIFDSLSGPNRWRIASTLREYLEMEWKMRKGTKKVFDRNTMQGFIVKCPQQTNFSDCGLYVLQYVESFFENPITHFGHPMDVTNWFTDTKISKKRQELKELILNLQKKYQTKQTNLSGVTIKKIIQPSASPIVSSTQTDNNR